MTKKINQMAVRYRSLADGDDVAFKWESSLNKILTPGNYAVEIEHYGADVGLPIEGCGVEHSIVGTLVVTDSGALDNKQGDRVMGQVLTFTLRESKETSIYTRTYAGGEWGEWCSLARTGMYDEISNADELYSTVSSLVSTTKELEDNLVYGIKQVVDADKVQISTTNEDGSVKDTLEIPAATIKKAGVMTAADKAKLNNDVPYPQETGTMVTSADKKYIYRGSGDTDVVAGLYWQAWPKTVDLRVKKWGMSTNDEVNVLSMPAATTESAGVMSAEDKKTLNYLYQQPYIADFSAMGFTLGFYNVQTATVGGNFNSHLYSSTTKYASSIDVRAGNRVKLCTYVTSGNKGAARPWVLVNANNIVVAASEALYTYDYTDGVEIDVPQDAKLYVACDVDYESIFSLEINGGVVYNFQEQLERVATIAETFKATNISNLYLPNNTVMLAGASISQKNGYFEYAMKKLGITGTNISDAGKNILHLCYKLYENSYATQDVLIISHIHNYDVYSLPASLESRTAEQYENDALLAPYLTTDQYISGDITPPEGYSVDEMYAIGYDYAIKKWIEKCYSLRSTDGYDALAGKNCQIVLMTYWHDGRTVYNNAIRRLSNKWGFPLIKEDENIGFTKDKLHPITGKQWSLLYCNGVPFSQTSEVINGVTYGFHPSGISSDVWSSFLAADAETMLEMLPDIQRRRAAIMIGFFINTIM